MKIYNSDGTFRTISGDEFGYSFDSAVENLNSEECQVKAQKDILTCVQNSREMKTFKILFNIEDEFGWSLSDFIVDESVPDYEMKNKHTRFNSLKRPTLDNQPNFFSSLESLSSISCMSEPVKRIIEIKPEIMMAKVMSTMNTIEGTYGPDGKLIKETINVDIEMPASKEKLCDLINPCNLEAKTLLSIVHYAKYEKLMNEMKMTGDIMDYIDLKNKVKFIITGAEDSENDLMKEIQNYHSNKEESMLSLMSELIFADMKCNIDDIVIKDKKDDSQNECDINISSTLSVPINYRTDNNHNTWPEILCPSETNNLCVNQTNLLKIAGFDESFDRSLQSCNSECMYIRDHLSEIRESLQHDMQKVDSLIEDTKALATEIKKVNFLDDILNLLSGQIEKVKKKSWPFKIFSLPGETSDMNMII